MTAVRFHRSAAGLRIHGPADFTPIKAPRVRRRVRAARTPRQLTAQRELHEAIATQPRGSVPCLDPDPAVRRRWTSDDPGEAASAAKDCRACPVRLLCRAVGRGEPSGVWGGIAKHNEGEAA